MFVDMNTAWILTQQRMQQQLLPEYAQHMHELRRERRRARRAWWHAMMLNAREAVARAKQVVAA